MSYIYTDSGYKFLSLHRKVIEYDPRNTDNLLILDYFNTMRKTRDDVALYYSLIETEYKQYKKGNIHIRHYSKVLHSCSKLACLKYISYK